MGKVSDPTFSVVSNCCSSSDILKREGRGAQRQRKAVKDLDDLIFGRNKRTRKKKERKVENI